MIEVRDKRILIDGTPRLLVSGEIHYFRLRPEEWEDRILKLKAAGGNTVASYIPWLCHEPERGHFDVDGHTRPALDLGAFIDLVASHDLHFIARPGPFVMAEMKNEGVPYYLYEDHPEIVPVTWDGKPVPTRTLDYLAPAFLAACRRWYAEVIPVIAARLHGNGGNVIGLQLDNEIGMLSWVSNSPDLTDVVLDDLRTWARQHRRNLLERIDVADDNGSITNHMLRSPDASISGAWMNLLGEYMRDRFRRYVSTLRGYAGEFGVRDIPFLVNVHGTEAGGGASFPIGISQLYRSYTTEPGYLAGSDHYLGDLTSVNAPDLYLMNALMEAVNRPEQPLTALEFEAGEGDYGETRGARLDPSAADFKLRMSVAQGNRMINYYLFTGGINYRMDRQTGDGNDRISITGERHGTNAPISPEGVENFTLPRLARTNHMLAALADKVATADEERDAVGFIPDYYMTESVYPGNPVMGEIAGDLRRHRFGGPGGAMARAMLHLTLRYTAIDVQAAEPDIATVPVLALGAATHMAADVQERLVRYLHAGGNLFLHGAVPLFDMTGAPCRVLHDALDLEWIGQRLSDHRTFVSATAEGWLGPRAEMRLGYAQTFRPATQGVLLRIYGADEACGFDIRVGAGRAVVISADVPADVAMFRRIFDALGVVPGLRHDRLLDGIFLTSTATPAGERFVHALNFDGVDKLVHLTLDGEPLCDGREIMLRRRDGVMLPSGVICGDVTIQWSTAEVLAYDATSLTVRLTGPEDALLLATTRVISAGDAYTIETRDGGVLVTSAVPGTGEETMTVRWA